MSWVRQDDGLPGELLEVGAFPRCGGAVVELVETHVSWVFLVGERVYKVKKALDLGFVDATQLDTRRAFCVDEVRLNAELAPGVHLGVVPIVRLGDEHGGRLVVDPEDAHGAEAVEYAVAMRRLPAQFMLERLLAENELDNSLVELVAQRLARFHAGALGGAGVDEHGTHAAVTRNVAENIDQTRCFADGTQDDDVQTLSPRLFAFLEDAQTRFLAENIALFEHRVACGRIRDGHGDLHASNICLEPDTGAPGGRRLSIFDRIEFSARLRCGDVAADLAFLAMDLDRRGFRAFSAYLVHRYGELAGDAELNALLPFYKTYRAWVRGKVGSMRAAQAEPGSAVREHERARAAAHFHLAATYTLPPGLVLMTGLPASGKSTLARELGRALGATLHNSDMTRKRLVGLQATSHARADEGLWTGLYGADVSDRTYAALLDAARADLVAGRSVVIDAAAPTHVRREPFAELARELGAPFVLAHVTCSPDVVAQRFAARAADRTEASDADAAVRAAMEARFEQPEALPPRECFEHRSGDPTDRAVAALLERWIPD